MIGPTLDTLITRVRAELSEGDADFFTDANVTTLLNAGQDAISMDCPWSAVATFTLTTVAGSASYLLADEVLQPMAAYYTPASGKRKRLDYLEPDLMDEKSSGGGTYRGQPCDVTYRRTSAGMEMEVWPAPSTTGLTLTVDAQVRPTELSATTDRTDLAPNTIQILVDYVLSKLKSKDEEVQQSNQYVGSYENGLKDLKARHMMEQADQFNRTRAYRGLSRRHPWGTG